MEDEVNTLIREEAYARYEYALENQDWETVNNIFIEMQEKELPEFEIDVVNSMNEDDLLAYRKWLRDNGDPEDN